MDKSRLETFSDGVFSVAMTLLVIDIHVPTLALPVTNMLLWQQLAILAPHVIVYAITFIVLSVFWINHHFLFHSFAKIIDRWLNLLNLLFLMFVAFVPFSASFIGEYYRYQPAAILYGVNIFCIVLISSVMFIYLKEHPKLLEGSVSSRLLNQGRFRSTISLFCYAAGIAISFLDTRAALFFFAFPVIFNIIPGTLDFTEKLFRFSLD